MQFLLLLLGTVSLALGATMGHPANVPKNAGAKAPVVHPRDDSNSTLIVRRSGDDYFNPNCEPSEGGGRDKCDAGVSSTSSPRLEHCV